MAEVIPVNQIDSIRTALINRDGLILVVQRGLTSGHNPGLWEVPGGKREQPGEPLVDAAIREFAEETGLQIDRHSIEGPLMLDRRIIPDGKYAGKPIREFGMTALHATGEIDLQKSECMGYRWRTRQSLVRSTVVTPITRKLLRELF